MTAWVRRASQTEGLLGLLEQLSVTSGQSQVLEDLHPLGKEDANEDDQDADQEHSNILRHLALEHRRRLR